MTEEQNSVKSDERLGPLSTTRHDKSAANVCDFVRNNRRVSIFEADKLKRTSVNTECGSQNRKKRRFVTLDLFGRQTSIKIYQNR